MSSTFDSLSGNDELYIVSIAQTTGGITFENAGDSSDEFPIEDIMDPENEKYENQQLYPPRPRFVDTYNLWLKHQSCFWSAHENDPSVDYDRFESITPEGFKKILLSTVGCIAIGDSIVLDKIASGINDKITAIELKAMFSDQESRELIHKKMYSHMLDVSPDSSHYRSEAFKNEFMAVLEDLGDKYNLDDIRVQMFFIMMCEIILFAPMFQTICYAATKGYCPKLCDLNLLVMRDEYIHYENARLQSSQFKTKLNIHFAREILSEFSRLTLELFSKIIGTYDDGIYNLDHVSKHFHHVVHGFMLENDLYLSDEERDLNATEFGNTPAQFYMSLPKCESKINRMESNSTIYAVPGDTSELVVPQKRTKSVITSPEQRAKVARILEF
ncbi:rr2 [Tomelloso virus]|uniref:ribonucleoside-diphosphate reductase n=1 Tax=Tomelloso virus TaxID=2053981 RepID=A0A2H4T2Q1_9VIRU|nr:rr2 [Tomelloso virus]ATY70202.1 rr2 [Tomelloso virus]